jgi:hypothetical protein|tara:strand:+ start:1090 stop:1230 length:141 start_codon:yes stop_codon:yes gene_type:complete
MCLTIGIIGVLLYLEVDYLTMGFYGMGLWGVTGLAEIERRKRKKNS